MLLHKRDSFPQSDFLKATVFIGEKPAGDTRASTGMSKGVTGIAPSSIICTEYDSATETK